MIPTPNGTPATDSTQGKRFLDVGCGSGPFSLCARLAGCKVVSFDYDPDLFQIRDRGTRSDSPGRVQVGGAVASLRYRSGLAEAAGEIGVPVQYWSSKNSSPRLQLLPPPPR